MAREVALNLQDPLTKWIWTAEARNQRHYFMFARRRFRLGRGLKKALLHISACDHYRLYVNGEYQGRGPQRGDPKWQTYDTYNITSLLKAGENSVAVQVYRYGVLNNYTRDTLGGLFVRLEMAFVGGKTEVLGTDDKWKVRAAKGWNREAKTLNEVALGEVTEVLDSRLDPADWRQTAFDDEAWEKATVIPRGEEPCPNLFSRDIPRLVEKEVYPKEVCSLKESVIIHSTAVDIPELLTQEYHRPLERCKIGNPEGLLRPGGEPTVVTLPAVPRDTTWEGDFHPHILVDFGRLLNAFPRVEVEGPAGTTIDLAYGQKLYAGRIVPMGGARYADRCIFRGGRQVWEVFQYKNFRYLQITVRGAPGQVKIHCASANTYRYPLTQKGRFACSDEVLTKVWQACINTMDLCTDDGYMDTSLREKRNWLGDGSHGLPAIYAGFGDIAMTPRYFKMTCWGGIGDGMLRSFYPGTDWPHEGMDMPKGLIPHHTLVWAMRFWEHWELFGQREILENAFPVLEGLAQWWGRNRDADGLLFHLPYWNWLDWSKADMRGESFATNAFYIKLLEDLANIAEVLGYPQKAPAYRQEANQIRQMLRTRFWDEKRGLFQDAYWERKLTGVVSELGNALAVLFDIADAKQARLIMAHLANPPEEMALSTPLFTYYIMQAFAKVGHLQDMLDYIRRRYGHMVANGETIWEAWHYRWPLAHCAGTTPAFVLSTDILGIRPLGAGFQRCRISPAVDLLEEASGIFPSVRGNIGVAWKRDDEALRLQISLPADLEGEVVLPGTVVRGKVLSVDGRRPPAVRRRGDLTLRVNKRKSEIVVAS